MKLEFRDRFHGGTVNDPKNLLDRLLSSSTSSLFRSRCRNSSNCLLYSFFLGGLLFLSRLLRGSFLLDGLLFSLLLRSSFLLNGFFRSYLFLGSCFLGSRSKKIRAALHAFHQAPRRRYGNHQPCCKIPPNV